MTIAPISSRNAVRLLVALGGLLLWSGAVFGERYAVPLLVAAGTPGEPQGVLRIVNGAAEPGMVTIYAIDDAGMRSGPATFTLNASVAAQFTAADLQSGNSARGLAGGIGADTGDARLVIETDLAIMPLAFVRAPDGTLGEMHDTVRAAVAEAGRFRYEVAVFYAAVGAAQASRLRLINPGGAAAAVTVTGIDDGGMAATGGDVTLTLPAGGARTLTAWQLEAGDAGLTGRLGAPAVGGWRLAVTADRPLQVMNIAASPTGYWSNLSTTAAGATDIAATAHIAAATATTTDPATPATPTAPVTDTAAVTGATTAPGTPAPGTPATPVAPIAPDAAAVTGTVVAPTTPATPGIDFNSGGHNDTGGYRNVCGGAAGCETANATANQTANGTIISGTIFRTMPADDTTDPDPDPVTVAPSFDLDEDNGSPEGIAWSDGRLHVVDRSADKVFAYGVEGYAYVPPEWRRQPSQDFDLDGENANPSGIAWSGDSFHVVDSSDDKVYVYAYGGQRRAEADFELDADNSRPGGIVWAERRIYVVDRGEDKAFAYGTDGQRHAEADFDLRDGNGSPAGVTWSGGRLYVADDTDDKVYAYGAGGVREAEYDFDLRADNGRPLGIVWADGRFRALDATEDKVYVYAAPPVPGGGAQTVYAAGDAILSLSAAAGFTLGDGGFVERRGYRYTCRSPAGCEVGGGAVASGSVARTQGGVEASDAEPEFAAGSGLDDLTFTAGEPIDALTLPEAGGGDGALTYRLSPPVPGLSFDTAERRLTGTPTVIGIYAMTYTAADADGDPAKLDFAITVKEPTSFRLGEDNGWGWGVVRAGSRFYIVDDNSDSVYAYDADWQRDPSADFALDADNGWPRGIAWDGARFYVTDQIDARVYAYGPGGQREASADYALDAGNSTARGIVWADGRFHVVDLGKVYAYGPGGQREASADFALDAANRGGHGIAWDGTRFLVTDYIADKVFAYGPGGQREASADFALESDNTFSVGIAWADNRFHVVDLIRDRAFVYEAP